MRAHLALVALALVSIGCSVGCGGGGVTPRFEDIDDGALVGDGPSTPESGGDTTTPDDAFTTETSTDDTATAPTDTSVTPDTPDVPAPADTKPASDASEAGTCGLISCPIGQICCAKNGKCVDLGKC